MECWRKALSVVLTDLAVGPEVARALDASELAVKVAMWVFASEYEDWRFLVASPKLDEARGRYGLIHEALEAAGISREQMPDFWILSMSDRTIRDLRRQYGKRKVREGMQIGPALYGDRFIEGGIVYRIR